MTFPRGIWLATGVICVLGLCAEVIDFVLGAPPIVSETFSLSYERNVPTWYASSLLLACAVVAARAAPHAGTPRRWRVLSGIFVFMSLDEAIEIHEHLGGLVDGSGVFFFSWVIPASVVVLGLGASMLPLLRALEPPVRRRVVLSGIVYVGGALLMELPLGWWTEQHGDDNLVYGLIDFVEESLELIGATLFVTTVWRIPETDDA